MEPSLENAIRILNFLECDIEDGLEEAFATEYATEISSNMSAISKPALDKLGITNEDFHFLSSAAMAYELTYSKHSKNRDRTYLSSRKMEVFMQKAKDLGLFALFRANIPPYALSRMTEDRIRSANN